MKHSLHTRVLALIMAIAIVLSTGVLNSAGWLLASGGRGSSVEETTETGSTQPSQGSSTTETLTVEPTPQSGEPTGSDPTQTSEGTSDPTETSEGTSDPTQSSEGTSDPTESSAPSESTEATEPQTGVKLTVVLRAVYSDGKQSHTLASEELVFGSEETEKTFVADIPAVEGYTFTVNMTLRADGKYETVLSRPDADATRTIDVNYTAVEPQETEPEETEPLPEGTVKRTVNVTFTDLGGVMETTFAQYTVTFTPEEETKDFTFSVPAVEGYMEIVDDEAFLGDGSGNYTATFTRPEADDTYDVEVFYRAVESVDPDEIEDPATPVATYNFYVDGELKDTQYVTNGGSVYAPASPEKDGYKFTGWKCREDEKFFTAGTASVTATTTLNYDAQFELVYYVFFLNTEGVVCATKEGTNGAEITADVTFPVDADQAITGWYTESALTNRVDSVILNGANVTLYPKVERGYWITYNADGGSYTAPAFVAPGTNTVEPAEPTRVGYTFKGWYNGDTQFAFGSQLKDNITLTAKWEGNANTQYTVIHWQENVDDDKFSFKESETKTGTTGDLTAAAAKSYDGFTVQTIEQKSIAGDGSTIVNVYYNRNEYKILFYILNCNNWMHSIFGGHDESCYQVEDNFTITAKYGANIRDQWPARSNGSTNWSTTKGGSGPYQAGIDVMPLGGATFYVPSSESDSSASASYYVEILEGETGSDLVTVGGKTYKLDHVDTVMMDNPSITWNEDFYDITGFTRNTTDSTKDGSRYNGAKFYYYRNSYEIKFINNGSVAHTVTKQYQADISDVSYTPTRPAGIPAEYTFVGWYDNELGQGEEYVFSGTMPAKSITVYAKWAAPEYVGTAYLTMAGGDSETIAIPYGSKINEDDLPTVTVPEGYTWRGWAVRSGTAPDYVYTPFNFDTLIYDDITLYPYYTSNQSFTITYDANGGSGTVPVDTKTYADGSYADVMTASTLTAPKGQVFLGWGTEVSGGTIYQPGDKIAVHDANITLYAIWGDQAGSANLIYNPNGGNGEIKTYVHKNNEKVLLQGNAALGFTRAGYRFAGWSESSSATTAQYAPGASILVTNSSDNVLYAVWEPIPITVTYRVEGNGSVTNTSDTLAADGDSMDGPFQGSTATPNTNYKFVGWYKGDTLVSSAAALDLATVKANLNTTTDGVYANTTFTAKFELDVADYTVRYVWNGVEIATTKTVTGTTIGTKVTEYPATVSGYTPKVESVNVTTTADTVITIEYYKNVVLTANSDTITYDGQPHSVSGFTVAAQVGDPSSASDASFPDIQVGATGTTAGTYPANFPEGNVPEGIVGTVDGTGKYIVVTANNGKLVITKSSALTVTATGYEGNYDAAAHVGTVTVNVTEGTTLYYKVGDGEWTTEAPTITNVGTVNVTVKATNPNYEDATDTYTLKVTPRAVTVTGDGWDTDQKYTGTEYSKDTYTFNNVVESQTATISYSIKGTDVGNYTGEFKDDFKVMSGTTDVTANYTLTTKTPGTLRIVKSAIADYVTLTPNPVVKTYDAATYTAGTATAVDTNGNAVKIEYQKANGDWTEDPTEITATNVADSMTVNVRASVEGCYEGYVEGTQALTINPRPVTLTSATDSKEYDGTPLTAESVTVSATTETSGFVAGEGVDSYQNFASVMLPNETADNTFEYTLKAGTKASNYDIKVVPGTLTINPRTNPYTITVTAKSGEREYNAQPFTVNGFKEITGTGITGNIQDQYDGSQKLTFTLSNGATFTISGIQSTRTETHVNPAAPAGVDELPYSAYDIPVTGTAVVTDGDGNDVTAQFAVTVYPGTLKITPRSVQLTSASDTKKFDKSPLTNDSVTVTSGSFANGDDFAANVTGSQTRIGSSENKFTYQLTGGAVPQDYSIEYVYGTLTVTPPDDYEIVEKTHTEAKYGLGDEITFTITVENIFDTDATVTVTEQEGVEFLDASGNKIGNSYPETTLAAGETLTVEAVYTVQEKDLLNGSFTNNVSVTIKATVDGKPYEGEDETSDEVDDLDDPKPELTVEKTVTSTPEYPELGYHTGEDIVYQIVVKNTGNLTISNIQVSDLISIAENPVDLTLEGFNGTLAPEESVTFTFTHTVVEEDLGKTIGNKATATGTNPTEDEDYEGEKIPTPEAEDEAEDVKTEAIRHELSITKEITNPKDIYKLQTPIQYQIVIANTGNVTERNVTVEDLMINAAHTSIRFKFTDLAGGTLVDGKVVFASLAPGESRVISCEYKIGSGDETNVVGNKATVTSDTVETVTSNTVEAQVETQYELFIIYVDENWKVVSPNYWSKMSVGDQYSITSPVVDGYTANRKVVMSGEKGMPAKDVWEYVIYTKNPEEPTEPTIETDPTDPGDTTPTEPTYDLTPLPDEKTPLADVELEGDHTCCLMHFLIMLVSMILLGFYTSDRKKLQKSIFELKRALKNEGVTVGSDDKKA